MEKRVPYSHFVSKRFTFVPLSDCGLLRHIWNWREKYKKITSLYYICTCIKGRVLVSQIRIIRYDKWYFFLLRNSSTRNYSISILLVIRLKSTILFFKHLHSDNIKYFTSFQLTSHSDKLSYEREIIDNTINKILIHM